MLCASSFSHSSAYRSTGLARRVGSLAGEENYRCPSIVRWQNRQDNLNSIPRVIARASACGRSRSHRRRRQRNARTRRPAVVHKYLSTHWFEQVSRLTVKSILAHPDGGFQVQSRDINGLSDGAVRQPASSLERALFRVISCERCFAALCTSISTRMLRSWRKTQKTNFVFGLDPWATGGPRFIRKQTRGRSRF